jgi:hypothetical protein
MASSRKQERTMGDERNEAEAFMHWFYGGTPPAEDERYIDAVVEMPAPTADGGCTADPAQALRAPLRCGPCAQCPRVRQTASLLRAAPLTEFVQPTSRRTSCSSGR